MTPGTGRAGEEWMAVDEVARRLLAEQQASQPATPLEALLAAQDLIADLSRIAADRSGREYELVELQERRARLAVAGLDLGATAEPAAARALVGNARAAVTDWVAAQDRLERLARGWAPEREEAPTHTLRYQPPLNHMSGRAGTWQLLAQAQRDPVGELLAPPYLGLEQLTAWAATVLPTGWSVARVQEGIPTGMVEPDDGGDPVFHLYAEYAEPVPF
ncbi:hypothetical protein ACPC54_18670 [Kitasatospora sp. NPDC094028]